MENKIKKFKPLQQFRYLPGSVSDETNKLDLKHFNEHKLRLFMAVPRVDTKPFNLNPTKWISIGKLKDNITRADQVDRQNKDLLKKINMINRKGGKVDTYNPKAYRRSNQWTLHKHKMKKIELENKEIYKTLIKMVSLYDTKNLNRLWQANLASLKHSSKFPLIILKKVNIDGVLQSHPSISDGLQRGNVERPLCFIEFKVKNGEYLGQIVIELYFDHVPVTVQNFLGICKSEGGLTYKNCIVHRIIKGQYLETGDITQGTGRGGFSIYGKSFQEENHMLKHTRAGVLSMKRIPPTENHSQFCITLARMDQLDHKNVVFGKVIKGNETLFNIEGYGRKIGKPHAEIIISNCGELLKSQLKFGAFKTIQGKSDATRYNVGVRNCKCLPSCQVK